MRQIILDTETTGLSPNNGDRIIEIGCIEMVNRKLTGETFHYYINPEREVSQGAVSVHGLTNDFLEDKPLFKDIAEEFKAFIKGAELVIHNAPFDVGFIEYEFELIDDAFQHLENYCAVLDTLAIARKKHPGQKNNLDALCKRYGIKNDHRELHGALLDSEILADVYLAMTGGQETLTFESNKQAKKSTDEKVDTALAKNTRLKVQYATDEELEAHQKILSMLAEKGQCLWLDLEKQ